MRAEKHLATVLSLSLVLMFSSCKQIEFGADILLDDLQDRGEYESSIVVDCSRYRGNKTNTILVNDIVYEDPGTISFDQAGYYHLEVYETNRTVTPSAVIRLVILDKERGEAEWGLPPWTPEGVKPGRIEEQEITVICPSRVPADHGFPVVVVSGGDLTLSTDNFQAELGGNNFLIKRGVGSGWLSTEDMGPEALKIDHRSFPVQPEVIDNSPNLLSGTLRDDFTLETLSYWHIDESLIIPAGMTLTIEQGVFLTIAPEVDIINDGTILIKGSASEAVSILCSNPDSFWGGIIGRANGNRVEARHALISGSGFHDGGDYSWGHAGRQALFFCEQGEIILDHCYLIDHIGQIFYPRYGLLDLDYCLIQRAKTGGQANFSEVYIDHCVFTDFPDDSKDYRDEDNDGLYLNYCDALINYSYFMYAKDDGLDSGANGGGNIKVSYSRFESNFHEGAALSSGKETEKLHEFTNCIFTDCGQGLELGYSSPNHLVVADSCTFSANGVGIRYGDSYKSHHEGSIRVNSSLSINNKYHDVWNMIRESWEADTSQMSFQEVYVSEKNNMYPELKVL